MTKIVAMILAFRLILFAIISYLVYYKDASAWLYCAIILSFSLSNENKDELQARQTTDKEI